MATPTAEANGGPELTAIAGSKPKATFNGAALRSAPLRYLYAILALGVLIVFHELGHLVFARLLGVDVQRFSLGSGPSIFSLRRGGTLAA